MYRIGKCKWNQSNSITVWWYCPPIWLVHVILVPCQHETSDIFFEWMKASLQFVIILYDLQVRIPIVNALRFQQNWTVYLFHYTRDNMAFKITKISCLPTLDNLNRSFCFASITAFRKKWLKVTYVHVRH